MNAGTDRNILKQLGMTSNEFSYISTLFTAGTVLAEIPSNMLIHKSTPRVRSGICFQSQG
jgi:hypothetical protein